MGLDWQCIAVPLDAEPVRVIRADAVRWEEADLHPPFTEAESGGSLPEISRALLAALPAGAGWIAHFGSRSYEQAEYLLDPAAFRVIRGWEDRERSLPYRIIQGDTVFAPHAQGGQGPLWRCSTKSFIADAVQHIDALDVAAVRAQFTVAEMVDLGVYKVHPSERDDDTFAGVLADLRAFADTCRQAVASELDLIITLW